MEFEKLEICPVRNEQKLLYIVMKTVFLKKRNLFDRLS